MLQTTMWHDQVGNAWQITFDVDVMRRVRAATGYDLAKLFTEEGMNSLATDPILLVDVLWQCVLPQAEAKKVAHSDFIKGHRGQAIESASDALVQAAIDFLPPSRAALLTRLRDRSAALTAHMMTVAADAIEGLQVPANSGNG